MLNVPISAEQVIENELVAKLEQMRDFVYGRYQLTGGFKTSSSRLMMKMKGIVKSSGIKRREEKEVQKQMVEATHCQPPEITNSDDELFDQSEDDEKTVLPPPKPRRVSFYK